jgi:hypothetical protein
MLPSIIDSATIDAAPMAFTTIESVKMEPGTMDFLTMD